MLGQVIIDPGSPTPTLNNGGWVYSSAILLTALGVIITLLIVFGYMRFAPRFQTDEGGRRGVRAPRLQPGKDVRRPVNVISAPLVVQPPMVAVAAAAAAPAPAAATAPAPAASPPAEAPAAEAPAAETPPAEAPAAAVAAPEQEAAPAADAAAPSATPAPAPAAAEHQEITLDQDVFDAKLAELLGKGTDRRVAEGQARRAAMLAARKKAEG